MYYLKNIAKKFINLLVRVIGLNPYIKTIRSLPMGIRIQNKMIYAANCQDFRRLIKTQRFYYQSDCNDALNFSARLDFTNWEVDSRLTFSKLAQSAELILDIGSYTGVYAMTAALNSPTASIIAFEPNPIIGKNLTRNIAINDLSSRIEVQQIALSDSNGHINLHVGKDSSMATILSLDIENSKSPEEIFQVIAKPLDDFVFLKPISLIKVDIEGSELDFLEGAQVTLQSHSPVILMEALNEYEFQKQSRFLQSIGYMCLGPAGVSTGDERNFLWTKQLSE